MHSIKKCLLCTYERTGLADNGVGRSCLFPKNQYLYSTMYLFFVYLFLYLVFPICSISLDDLIVQLKHSGYGNPSRGSSPRWYIKFERAYRRCKKVTFTSI